MPQLHPVEKALMVQIRDGRTIVNGPDAHTMKRLIASGYAAGTDDREGGFCLVELTPIGLYELNASV